MKFTRVLTAIAAAGGLVMAAPGAGVAQEPVPQEQPAIEMTDEVLERFVAVYPAVVEVAQAAQAELAQAETPEQAQAIQADAQAQVTAVLEESELSVTEYEAVVIRLNEDPELAARVQEMLVAEDPQGGMNR